MDSVSKFLYRKETLLWTPLLLDCCLAMMTYPMFQNQGPRLLAPFMKLKEEPEIKEMEEDNRIQTIWETTMIAYSGYAVLLGSSTYCAYLYPETQKPLGWAMLALMFSKILHLKEEAFDGDKETKDSKTGILYKFYLPFYGGYCMLNLVEWYKANF